MTRYYGCSVDGADKAIESRALFCILNWNRAYFHLLEMDLNKINEIALNQLPFTGQNYVYIPMKTGLIHQKELNV